MKRPTDRSIQRLFRVILLTATLSTGLATVSVAQLGSGTAGTGIRLESYYFGDPEEIDIDRIRLLTIPIGVRVPLARDLEVGIDGAFARAAMRRYGTEEVTVSGLTDTRVDLTLALAGDRIRLGLVGLVPTGISELTNREMDVAGVIAADLLPFAISSWGTGGGIGMNAAAAVPLNDETALGFSGGYLVAREYEPLADNSFAYRPGDQLQLRAVIDRTIGSSGKASLQVTYFRFGEDQQDGANLYQPGDRFQVVGSYAFAAGYRGSGVLYTGYLARARGRYTDAALVLPVQRLAYFGVALRQPLGRRMVFLPGVDVRLLNSDAGEQQGYTITGGVGLEIPIGGLDFIPTANGRIGNVTARGGDESRFTGIDLGVTLRKRGSR